MFAGGDRSRGRSQRRVSSSPAVTSILSGGWRGVSDRRLLACWRCLLARSLVACARIHLRIAESYEREERPSIPALPCLLVGSLLVGSLLAGPHLDRRDVL